MIRIHPAAPLHLEAPSPRFDLLVGALGYETRSLQIPRWASADSTLLLDLHSEDDATYRSNSAAAIAAGMQSIDEPAHELADWFARAARAARASDAHVPHIGVDVSSLPRDRIARLVEGLAVVADMPALVTVLYAPAVWRRSTRRPELIEVLGPVSPRLAGHAPTPEAPVVAFVGLGVEQDRAIGAIEYIEPAESWLFLPTGEDEQFDRDVLTANDLLLEDVDVRRRISYRVDDPFSLYGELEALVFSAQVDGRPVLVPLGPKIFAACSALVAVARDGAGVWRVSSGGGGEHHDQVANGKIVRLALSLGDAVWDAEALAGDEGGLALDEGADEIDAIDAPQ